MEVKNRTWKRVFAASGFILLGTTITLMPAAPRASAGSRLGWWWERHSCAAPFAGCGEEPPTEEIGGAWYWLRSPEQEKRVVNALFNRYCVRCHGIDGRGVWDMPDVPNFTNARWQALHSDGQLARSILEGRGSVMPPWRGVVSLEEAWALARYVRTLVPGSEASRPDFNAPEKVVPLPKGPATKPK